MLEPVTHSECDYPLKELGYRVIEAVDGNEALPVIEGEEHIDLLISDVGLPGLNGRQIAEIAIAARPTLKILFVTGYAATAASRADFLAPGMEMMTKPFAIDNLAQKVSEILFAPKLRRVPSSVIDGSRMQLEPNDQKEK
jgi:CheY-like chemotaxis protein